MAEAAIPERWQPDYALATNPTADDEAWGPQIVRELILDVARLEGALRAANRLIDNKYLAWDCAGGLGECKHGFAAPLDCRKCDEEAVRAALEGK